MKAFAFALLQLAFIKVIAQNEIILPEPLLSDRPGVGTDAPDVVKPLSIQTEVDISYFRSNPDNAGKIYRFSLPSTLLRIGILSRLELRVSTKYFVRRLEKQKRNYEVSGFAPLSVGFKFKILEERKSLPKISVLSVITLEKTGKFDFRRESSVTPLVRLLASKRLTEKMLLIVNGGTEWNLERSYPSFTYGAFLRFLQIKKEGVFIEAYGAKERFSSPQTFFDYGFTYSPQSNLLFDISNGYKLFAEKQYFIEVGVTWRIK